MKMVPDLAKCCLRSFEYAVVRYPVHFVASALHSKSPKKTQKQWESHSQSVGNLTAALHVDASTIPWHNTAQHKLFPTTHCCPLPPTLRATLERGVPHSCPQTCQVTRGSPPSRVLCGCTDHTSVPQSISGIVFS